MSTGCYQTALLAELADRVWSVEIVEELPFGAELRLGRLGYSARVGIRVGDGSRGWAEHAPFDKILVAAAEPVPPALLGQLKQGGRLVMPLGPAQEQRLTVIDKGPDGRTRVRELIPVLFSRLETIL